MYNSIYSLQSFVNQFIPIILIIVLVNMFFWAYKFFKSPKEKEALHAWYKRKFLRSVGLVVLAPFIWGVVGFLGSVMGVSSGGQGPSLGFPSEQSASVVSVPRLNFGNTGGMMVPPPQSGNNSIADTREYTKMSYSGNIKTREVESVARKVKLLIKGVGGRIDSSNISDQYATFSFVIPKSEYDGFEDEIRGYVNAKFYSQTVSSQNRLADKQSLERSQDSTSGTITSLTDEQQKVKDTYTRESKAITTQVAVEKAKLATIQAKLAVATATVDINPLTYSQSISLYNLDKLNTQLASLTSTFKTTMSGLGASLDQQKSVLDSLAKSTNDLLDDVETVQGYVAINYISLWEIFFLFSPISPLGLFGIIIVLLIGYSLYSTHKKEKELLAL